MTAALAVQRPAPDDPAAEAWVAVEPAQAGDLSPGEAALLKFERRWWRHTGAKDQAIHVEFCVSPTRYYQRLNALIDTPAALAADPVLVNRLRRGRDRLVSRRAR